MPFHDAAADVAATRCRYTPTPASHTPRAITRQERVLVQRLSRCQPIDTILRLIDRLLFIHIPYRKARYCICRAMRAKRASVKIISRAIIDVTTRHVTATIYAVEP